MFSTKENIFLYYIVYTHKYTRIYTHWHNSNVPGHLFLKHASGTIRSYVTRYSSVVSKFKISILKKCILISIIF